jgi:hypothetical protein
MYARISDIDRYDAVTDAATGIRSLHDYYRESL